MPAVLIVSVTDLLLTDMLSLPEDSLERKSVKSTNLVSVKYDPKSKVLEIQFKSGGIYQYSNVPVEKYHALGDAEPWLMVRW